MNKGIYTMGRGTLTHINYFFIKLLIFWFYEVYVLTLSRLYKKVF